MNIRAAFILSMVAITATVACSGSGAEKAPPTSPVVAAGTTASAGTGTGGTTAPVGTLTGTVSGLAGTCPALTFKLENKTIKTTATTSFGDRACADVKDGVKVGVVGTAQADGSILATKVGIVPPPPVTVTGTVTALSGTCPAVTFKLENRTIKTSAATSFGDRVCGDVKDGVKVGVIGTAQADGSILATKVGIVPPPTPAPVPAITGVITALAGSCPALTITVGAKTATTSSATVFDGKSCADLKVGLEVGIFGSTPTGGATLLATKVVSRK